jgi:DNA polymerase-4
MENQKIDNSLKFNAEPSRIMHIDLNSCFATIEQQANPLLRGKPVAVAAFTSPGGCILAASVEAKRLGIKTGMRVRDGREIFKDLVVLSSDPWKYRNVHLKLRNLISEYTNDFSPKSIDEFVLNMQDYPKLKGSTMQNVAREIKRRIKSEIGNWLTVSVGVAPNRYLAKVAAGLHKPDGLDEINKDTFPAVYSALGLTDLTGIKDRNAARLNSVGIYTVQDFYEAPLWKIKAAFHSINALYWQMRLKGYEIDNVEFGRRSYGNSVAIGKNLSKIEELCPILARLTEKTCSRLRHAGYTASGIHLALAYKDGNWWHEGKSIGRHVFDARDVYKAAFRLLLSSPSIKPNAPNVLNIAVSCFGLTKNDSMQLEIFSDVPKKRSLVVAEDKINERWGDFTVGFVTSFGGAGSVRDRIAFGGIKELEEFTLRQPLKS